MDVENKEFLLFLRCAQQNGLRYLCIGGYAVNYHGFHRATEDLDIWIAPTDENKNRFLQTLRCMNYAEEELADIREEDFTTYFMCTLGTRPNVIDVLTIVHKNISFDEAEKEMIVHTLQDGTGIKLVPFSFLKEMKLRSTRQKDLWDVARLEELFNKQKKQP